MQLDQVTITAADFAASLAFYDAALGALGMARVVEVADEEEDEAGIEAVGWGGGEVAELWLVTGPEPTVGAHVSLTARSREDVEAFHAAALSVGGRSHDAPRRWAIYHRGRFGATVLDPAGNLIEAHSSE